jgi:hypothetical protein
MRGFWMSPGFPQAADIRRPVLSLQLPGAVKIVTGDDGATITRRRRYLLVARCRRGRFGEEQII